MLDKCKRYCTKSNNIRGRGNSLSGGLYRSIIVEVSKDLTSEVSARQRIVWALSHTLIVTSRCVSDRSCGLSGSSVCGGGSLNSGCRGRWSHHP